VGHFIIKAKLPSLNEVIDKNRANRYAGNQMKKEIEELICKSAMLYQAAGRLSPMGETPCYVYIDWHEKTMRRDADNIQSSKKFILDALQKCGILKDDSRKYVKQIYDLIVDDKEDYVVVRLEAYEG
jgi:Holliday junction resolvase RusA-like endonuclease